MRAVGAFAFVANGLKQFGQFFGRLVHIRRRPEQVANSESAYYPNECVSAAFELMYIIRIGAVCAPMSYMYICPSNALFVTSGQSVSAACASERIKHNFSLQLFPFVKSEARKMELDTSSSYSKCERVSK